MSRQQRGNGFTDLETDTVTDSHFHPLDLSYVSSTAHKVLHAASCEGFLSFWQVQPQPVCLQVVWADDDDVDPGCSAGIMVYTRGQGEVIANDWVEDKNWSTRVFKLKEWFDILANMLIWVFFQKFIEWIDTNLGSSWWA